MRILYITSVGLDENYGATKHIKMFIKSCQKISHDVILLSFDFKKRNLLNNFLFVIKSFIISIKNLKKINIVYIRYFPFSFIFCYLFKLFNKKVIVEYNAVIEYERKLNNKKNFKFFVNKLLSFLSAKSSNKIITLSDGIKNYISKKYKIREKNIFVSSNGSEIKKAFNKPITYKGLMAYTDVPWYNTEENIRLKDKLKSIGIELHLYIAKPLKRYETDNIFYNALIDYSNYDFGLYINDPILGVNKKIFGVRPIKLFEYMSNSLFVIVSNIPDINKIVIENKVGLVFNNYDEILELLEKVYLNKETIIDMQRNANNLIKNKYNWLNLTKEIFDFIEG